MIITSRQLNWPSYIFAEGVKLLPFTENEAVSFVRSKVPGLAFGDGRKQLTQEEDTHRENEAKRLATELGHLPIAIDHAAAYLAEHDAERRRISYAIRGERSPATQRAARRSGSACPHLGYMGDVHHAPDS